ncbi:MAG: PocR ligand-binding domain-containing protein [Candidatus Omnitrophota bacterium]|nr:PocR ligand-binding domain-containing protein [Candidatus Omnitrophota bacterium]
MTPKQLVEELIEKDKWAEFLRRFIDVLKINLFVVDHEGKMLVPPYRNGDRRKFQNDLLVESFGFDFSGKGKEFFQKFDKQGPYWEASSPFDMRIYAVPVSVEGKTFAYTLVGPVILNRRLEAAEYVALAQQQKVSPEPLVDAMNEVRVVSFVTMKAILDLLSEVIKDVVELSLERRKLHETRFNREILPKEITDAAQEMYKSIHEDELLVTILDVALNLTRAECGSIMLLDEKTGELAIKVSRGLGKGACGARVKMGEGVAGVAAQENTPFLISGVQGDNRIKHLLKRPEIKTAVVMPLTTQDRVFGVLNLHAKSEDNSIEAGMESLQNFGRLVTAAMNSF